MRENFPLALKGARASGKKDQQQFFHHDDALRFFIEQKEASIERSAEDKCWCQINVDEFQIRVWFGLRTRLNRSSTLHRNSSKLQKAQAFHFVGASMIIYKCRFTGDEMLSDAFKPSSVKDAEGNEVEGLIQIQSQKVNKVRSQFKKMTTVGIGQISHNLVCNRTREHQLILDVVTNSVAVAKNKRMIMSNTSTT